MSNLGVGIGSLYSKLNSSNKISQNTAANIRNNNMPTDSVTFTGNNKKAIGEFANKKFEVECSEGLKNRTLSGKIDDLSFHIKHNGKIFKADTITGNIGDKALNLKVSESLTKRTINGNIGQDIVDLKVTETWSGYRIKGQFKNKNVDIKLNSKWVGYSLESDNMSLNVKSKTLFGNDVKVKGSYNEDPDLIPILMDSVYSLNNEELAMAVMM